MNDWAIQNWQLSQSRFDDLADLDFWESTANYLPPQTGIDMATWHTDKPPEGDDMVRVRLNNGKRVVWTAASARYFWKRTGIPNGVTAWQHCEQTPDMFAGLKA